MDTLGYDPLAGGDFLRDELRDSSACRACGSLMAARVEADGCSECQTYPRCDVCSRWVGAGDTWLPGYVWALDEAGRDIRVCDPCRKEAA